MTKEVEPSVKDERVELIRDAIDRTTSMYHSAGYNPNHADKNCTPCRRYEALDSLSNQLQEAEERAKKTWWNKREHELEDEIAALEEAAATTLSLAESERDAAIAEKDEWKRGAEAAYAAHDATMAQLQEAEATLARWVDNDPSVSPGENIRMMQDALASQLRQKDEEIERLKSLLSKIGGTIDYWGNEGGWTEPNAVKCFQAVESLVENALSTPETGGDRRRMMSE